MATITWPGIKTGLASLSSGQDDSIRRVAVRLAIQTVALVLVMLILLEVVVYGFTQYELQSSLQMQLKDRAHQVDPTVCVAWHLSCAAAFGGPRPGFERGPPQSGRQRGPGSVPGRTLTRAAAATQKLNPIEVYAVYFNTPTHPFHGDTAIGTANLDPQGLKDAFKTGKAQCCSVRSYRDESYLVYSAPLRSHGRVAGVVQTSTSRHQYEDFLSSLLQVLLGVALLGLLTSSGVSVVLVRRALQPIRAAMQRQRDFVADAAHELRTPLAIQRTAGEVGLGNESDEDQQATIEQMLAENHHLTRLVDDLSLLARADSNAVSIDRSSVDLSSLVTDTTAELRPLAEEQGVQLTVEAAAHVGVIGDPTRLRQLLLILLDNALKHTPAGGAVSVRLRADGNKVRLQVADTGPGINPADLPRIFDRFYQADHARTGSGSGLGLAIGRWITEAHGGQIQAGNLAPHGAIFTVTLPHVRSAAAG